MLIGLSSWAVAAEFFALQSRLVPPSEALTELNRQIQSQMAGEPLLLVVLLLAVVPAFSEEFLFRGFLLSSLGRSTGKWTAILAAGLIFGVFHFNVDRIPMTAMMGVLLGYLCWQAKSLWPGILAHIMHNASLMVLSRVPRAVEWLRLGDIENTPGSLLPLRVIIPAVALFIASLAILATLSDRPSDTDTHAVDQPPRIPAPVGTAASRQRRPCHASYTRR